MVLRTAHSISAILRSEDVVARVDDQNLAISAANVMTHQEMSDLAHRVLYTCTSLTFPGDTFFEPSIGFALTSQGDDLGEVLDFALSTERLSLGARDTSA